MVFMRNLAKSESERGQSLRGRALAEFQRLFYSLRTVDVAVLVQHTFTFSVEQVLEINFETWGSRDFL